MKTTTTAVEFAAKNHIPERFLPIIRAYSDSHELADERCLDFCSKEPMTAEELLLHMPLIVPGYNHFGRASLKRLVTAFKSAECRFYVAREGSVCIYVQVSTWVLLNDLPLICDDADESSFHPETGRFRFWWD